MNSDENCNEDVGEISGYAGVFNVVDGHGDVIVKGAFKNSINLFRESKKRPKFLWQHDAAVPIGVIDDLFEDDYGLFIRGHLLTDIPKAKEAYALVKNNAINGFSIGYRIKNKYKKGGIQYLTDIDLLEISIVTFPACEQAIIRNQKSNDLVYELKTISDKIKKFNQRR